MNMRKGGLNNGARPIFGRMDCRQATSPNNLGVGAKCAFSAKWGGGGKTLISEMCGGIVNVL